MSKQRIFTLFQLWLFVMLCITTMPFLGEKNAIFHGKAVLFSPEAGAFSFTSAISGINEYCMEKNGGVIKAADWVALITNRAYLTPVANQRQKLTTYPASQTPVGLCATDPFSKQPTVYDGDQCTGVLVADNLVATAGHCLRSTNDNRTFKTIDEVKQMAFVFGYRKYKVPLPAPFGKGKFFCDTRIVFDDKDVYYGDRIVAINYDPNRNGPDWALVQLDRKIPPNGTAKVAEISSASISIRQTVFLLGYPMGLPLKISASHSITYVKDNLGWFQSPLNAFKGSSGSPVFKLVHGKPIVVGIAVRAAMKIKTKQSPTQNECSLLADSLCSVSQDQNCNQPLTIYRASLFKEYVTRHKGCLDNPAAPGCNQYFTCINSTTCAGYQPCFPTPTPISSTTKTCPFL